MSLNRKQIISILIILAIAALIGFLMYIVFFKGALPGPTPPADEEPIGGLPDIGPAGERERVGEDVTGLPDATDIAEDVIPDEVAAGGVTSVESISDDATLGPTLLPDGSLAYYNENDSKFYKVTSDGKIRELASKEFFNVQNVNWSSSGDRAILEYPDGSKIAYDFGTNRQYTLPKEWEEFSFNSSGNRIAFKHMASSDDNRWLASSNFDGSGITLYEPLGENAHKVNVSWSPTGQTIANHWKSIDGSRQEIYFIGQNEENFKSMVVEGYNFKSSWTPDGHKLVYSVYDTGQGYLPNLWVVNAYGENIGTDRRDLGVNTWIDKCSISPASDYAYCAVPQTMPEGAGLYPELTYNIPDDFYRINIRTGFKELLAKPYGDYTADQVMLAPGGDKLYFRDINTGRLHEIRLK